MRTVDQKAPKVTEFDATFFSPIEHRDLAIEVFQELGLPEDIRMKHSERTGEDKYFGDPNAAKALFEQYGISPIGYRDQIRTTAEYLRALISEV